MEGKDQYSEDIGAKVAAQYGKKVWDADMMDKLHQMAVR